MYNINNDELATRGCKGHPAPEQILRSGIMQLKLGVSSHNFKSKQKTPH